ncbi:3029_t:CDS:2, partial [Acaulospora morrowiae]
LAIMAGKNSISFIGSVALLVSSMTGPGVVTIPLLFQSAGWLIPLVVFALAVLLSGFASLFLCEALSSIHGNERFQASVKDKSALYLF